MEANPSILQNQRGDVSIKIGDTGFVLEPTAKNIDAVESTLGKSFVRLAGEIGQNQLSLTSAEFSSFVFITQKDPKISFAKIRQLIHVHGSVAILPAVAMFVNSALAGLTEQGEDEVGNQQAKASP